MSIWLEKNRGELPRPGKAGDNEGGWKRKTPEAVRGRQARSRGKTGASGSD